MHRWNSDQSSEKQSQVCTVSTANLENSDLNQYLFINTKSGIRLLLPVPQGGSGMNTGGARNYFEICCSKIVYSWWQSAATDGVCERNTLSRHLFSCLHAYLALSYTTVAQSVVRITSSMCHAFDCASWFSSTLHSALFKVSLIFHFILLIVIFIFHVGRFGEKYLVRFREWGVMHFGRQHASHTFRLLLAVFFFSLATCYALFYTAVSYALFLCLRPPSNSCRPPTRACTWSFTLNLEISSAACSRKSRLKFTAFCFVSSSMDPNRHSRPPPSCHVSRAVSNPLITSDAKPT